jgi:hypothetical protein
MIPDSLAAASEIADLLDALRAVEVTPNTGRRQPQTTSYSDS